MLKRIFFIIILFSGWVHSQYGSIELSSGGFSFVPAFTDASPNFIIHAGTSTNKLLSAHMIGNVRVNQINPRAFIFITRAKVLDKKDKKLKLSAGIHIPVLQIDEEDRVSKYFAQEVIATYPLSKKHALMAMYIHGKGTNNELEINLVTLSSIFQQNKFSFTSQLYYLDLDRTYGLAETISYHLSPRFDLRGFVSQTLSTPQFIWTLGLRYKL